MPAQAYERACPSLPVRPHAPPDAAPAHYSGRPRQIIPDERASSTRVVARPQTVDITDLPPLLVGQEYRHRLGEDEWNIFSVVPVLAQPVLRLRRRSVVPLHNILTLELRRVIVIVVVAKFAMDEDQSVRRKCGVPVLV